MPTIEEMERSELYLSELEDALKYYVSQVIGGSLMTLTVRPHETGPRLTLVSRAVFPPLDDLLIHLDNTVYAATRLDLLPAEYWHYMDSVHPKPFYIPMQIIFWGRFGGKPGTFTKEAELYREELKRFPWSKLDFSPLSEGIEEQLLTLDHYRDYAEHAKRILYTYNNLKKHFDKTGLPSYITEF